MIRRARELVKRLTAEDLSLIQAKVPTPYKKRGAAPNPKHKGGSPPIDYDAVETLEDLRRVLNVRHPDPERVIPLFVRLRSLVGG